jgi:non-ribosomal peptide synthetase component E (peptide arylation enzyme)
LGGHEVTGEFATSSSRVGTPDILPNVHQLVWEQAGKNPDAVALLAPGRSAISYARLLRVVEETGEALRAAGFSPGNRVAAVAVE